MVNILIQRPLCALVELIHNSSTTAERLPFSVTQLEDQAGLHEAVVQEFNGVLGVVDSTSIIHQFNIVSQPLRDLMVLNS